MLTHLSITNYALIKSLELDIQKGLTVLTGETGSGKSIMLGALGLVLGDRADLKSLAIPDSKCIIEATFFVHKRHQAFFKENDLDFHEESILRREISTSGKSRAFINDTPVNLVQLKTLGSQLVEIHSQDQNSVLSQTNFQFEILDSFANTKDTFAKYQLKYKEYAELKSALKKLQEKDQKSQADLDYFSFQYNELKESNLDYIDKDALEKEQNTITHASDIGSAMDQLNVAIEDQDDSILNRLNQLSFDLDKKLEFHSEFPEIKKRVDSVIYELQDLSGEASRIKDSIEMDPERFEQVQSILNDIYALENKHRVSSIEELVELRDNLETKLSGIQNLEEEIEKIQLALETSKTSLTKIAQELHSKRSSKVNSLQSTIESTFKNLGLDFAQLRIILTESDDFNPFGKEQISFEFCANPGSSFSPIEKVASGGEKSRVLLALKKVFSDLSYFPTLILDEIDSGVSGEIGKKVGQVMQAMSANSQILAITHLPQIAGMGDHHFKVSKSVVDGQTITQIQPLNSDSRVDELAEMLSGKNSSEAAKENAKELLNGV